MTATDTLPTLRDFVRRGDAFHRVMFVADDVPGDATVWLLLGLDGVQRTVRGDDILRYRVAYRAADDIDPEDLFDAPIGVRALWHLASDLATDRRKVRAADAWDRFREGSVTLEDLAVRLGDIAADIPLPRTWGDI